MKNTRQDLLLAALSGAALAVVLGLLVLLLGLVVVQGAPVVSLSFLTDAPSADMVSGVVRQTGIDGINAAMAVAASGSDSAPKDALKIAHQILERASVMQSEISRFLAIAGGRHAA